MPDDIPEIVNEINWEQLSDGASSAFTPASPVSEKELFAGRIAQVRLVVDAINLPGQHAIIYGERGVGKTSLANILSSRLVSKNGVEAIAPRINCDGTDNFEALWKKALGEIEVEKTTEGMGFASSIASSVGTAVGLLRTYLKIV